MLYETMSRTFGGSFKEPYKSYLKTIYVNYDEYKKMTKSDKLYHFESYIKNNKILSFINNNIISVIGIIIGAISLVLTIISVFL